MKNKQLITVYYDTISGERHKVGQLFIADKRIGFEYDSSFVGLGIELSPFHLPVKLGAQYFSADVFSGLPGVFNDSLPDGWGLLLMDRYFRRQQIDLMSITPLMRLAFVGDRAVGALSYQPAEQIDDVDTKMSLHDLANHAEQVFSGKIKSVLPALLIAGGSPAGARPKVLADVNFKTAEIIYGAKKIDPEFIPYLIKFFTHQDNSDVGKCEFAYAEIARLANIDMPNTHLFNCGDAGYFFGVQRFDRINGKKIHMHTMSGLLQLDYRLPMHDYLDLLKLTQALTHDQNAVEQMFRRMVFNIIMHNRDDHSKNFAFQLTQNGWEITPAYDLTYSPGPGGEHTMTIAGEGREPALKHLQSLAKQMMLPKSWLQNCLDEVINAAQQWPQIADQAGVYDETMSDVQSAIKSAISRLVI